MTLSGFHRVDEKERRTIALTVDGTTVTALEGDMVLTALLLAGKNTRRTEWSGEPRAGFCFMGACSDCVVWCADASKIRACSTPAVDGMILFTQLPEVSWPTLL
jgi:NADH dehydrogenase/NADH:ubiquinone oxidoreductase subunit G